MYVNREKIILYKVIKYGYIFQEKLKFKIMKGNTLLQSNLFCID